MNLFELATRHRSWLGLRQSTVAQNIAHANTPGYKAHGVADFASTLTSSGVTQAVTHHAHMSSTGQQALGSAAAVEPEGVTHSGNSVDVEQQLLAAGEVNRGYALNVSVVKTFRRMLMAGVRT